MIEPRAVSWLLETWIPVYGVPDKLRREPLAKEFLRVVGKMIVVDELSLIRFEEPVWAKIWCRKAEKIHGFFEIFHGVDGFQMRVEREVGGGHTLCTSSPLHLRRAAHRQMRMKRRMNQLPASTLLSGMLHGSRGIPALLGAR